MNKEVLVSIYDREYSWIKKLNKDIRLSLYKKGDRMEMQPNEIFLSPNVGRDVHTFFSHLHERYYSLSDYTFTCQDYFEDHVNNYIYIMNSNPAVWNEEAKQIIENECWFFSTHHGLIYCERDGSPHHPGLNITDMWSRLFKSEMPEHVYFTAAGHFCITANQVRKRPPQFYKKIVDILANEHIAPWIIERLEGYIFDSNYEIVDC
jgi:hypothetical protein